MINKVERTVHDNKAPGLNNPKNYALTHNRFDTYMVLFFSNLNETQIYKMPYRDSLHHEIEKIMSSNYLNNCLNQMNTKEIIILENQTMRFFYSKVKIKNMFMWEKNYFVLKQLIN